ncbi:MAG: D-alanine--D-alanine ligase [Oscillospiraceae bacterium]|nr:D-alanine--D-alanine ligase [Oscillospiraceae bacterium]
MSKITVAVLFGGVSSEHDVSLLSASSVIKNIPAEKYDVVMVGITKEGKWLRYTGDPAMLPQSGWLKNCENLTPAVISPDRTTKGLLVLEKDGWKTIPVDVVFPVLHGKNGEDGTMQGLLELAGIPYVGCGVLSSAMCMDKAVAHMVLEHAGIPMAKWELVRTHEMNEFDAVAQRLENAFPYPMFVKPANAGSSVGVSKAKDRSGLRNALEIAFKEDSKVIVETTIVGKEVETAVLGNFDAAAAQVIGELTPAAEFYDYNAKYIDGTTELHIPARISEEMAAKLRELAVKAYKALDCKGLTRVDFFALEDGSVILNELNTLPGFTSISMYPKLWEASGVPYSELLDKVIGYALESKA